MKQIFLLALCVFLTSCGGAGVTVTADNNFSVTSTSGVSSQNTASSASNVVSNEPVQVTLDVEYEGVDQVTLAWTARGGQKIQSYTIYQDQYFVTTVPSDEHSYTDKNLLPGTQYNYSLVANTANGGVSKPSYKVVQTLKPSKGNSSSQSSISSSSSSSSAAAVSSSSAVAVSSGSAVAVSSSSAVAVSSSSAVAVSSSSAVAVSSSSAVAVSSSSAVAVSSSSAVAVSSSSAAAVSSSSAVAVSSSSAAAVSSSSAAAVSSSSAVAVSSSSAAAVSSSSAVAVSSSSAAAVSSSSASSSAASSQYVSWAAPTSRENGTFLSLTELGGYSLRYMPINSSVFSYVTLDSSVVDYFFSTDVTGATIEISAFDNNGLYSDFVPLTLH